MSQSKRKKREGAAASRNSVAPTRSRTPFFVILGALAVAGAVGIYYSMNSAPKPIVLAQGTVLPKAEGYLMGRPDAPVTIMEFADFECPQCANFFAVTEPDVRKRIVEAGLANMRYYDFPIPELHPNSLFASLAASCAADQGQFWPMHDALLQGQLEWEGRSNKNPKKVFDRYVTRLKLDAAKFDACFDSRDNVPRIQANHDAGLAFQVSGTPSFVIGGVLYRGNVSYDKIKAVVDSILATKGPERAPVKPESGAKVVKN